MLTKKEIDSFWESQKKYIIPHIANLQDASTYWSISTQGRLCGFCKFPETAKSLIGFNSVVQRSSFLFEEDVKLDRLWNVFLDPITKIFIEGNRFNDIQELEESITTFYKFSAMDRVTEMIKDVLDKTSNNLSSPQVEIYLIKKQQSKEILSNNIQVDEFGEYVFISKYAEMEKLTLQEAAERILLKSRLRESDLSDFETFRLQSKKDILSVKNMKELYFTYFRCVTVFSKYGTL